MGIQGLLPVLKSVMSPIHIKELAGKCVAVDTYSWLHKGAFSCSRDLSLGLPTRRHIEYCMHRVNLLRHHGVKPILIFDGGFLPMKAEQETKRARARKENLERATEHESCGNNAAAYECYQKAVDISPLIAFQLIEVLRKENVEYIVAPYEADAQMAYLSIKKHVEAVITEDSDLIPFGCVRIIFKMDKYGNGVEFQYAELARNKDLNFTCFTKQMVLEMCILSGCDYLQSLQGMGIKKAYGLISRFKSYEKIIKHLRYSGISIPPLYEETFKKAILTFRHQCVYDPVLEDIVHLTELPCNLHYDMDFFGPPMPQNLARAIARGEVDPITKEPFQDTSAFKNLTETNYNASGFHREKQKRVLELPAQKNVLTNYFCVSSTEAKQQFRAPRIIPGGQEQNKELPFTCDFDFEEMLQESPARLRTSTSGSLDRVPTFSKIFLSDHLENDKKEGRNIGNAYEYRGIWGKGKNIMTRESSGLEISPSSASDITFQGIGPSTSRPSVPARKIINSRQPSDIPVVKVSTGLKRETILRSRYFPSKVSDIVDLDDKEAILTNKEDMCDMTWDMDKLQKTIDVSHHGEKASYITRNVSNGQQPQQDSAVTDDRKRIRLHDAIISGKGKHVPTFRSDLISKSVQQEKFACNLSHIEQYSDIAEQSMERFASTLSSFQCITGRARASGLRPPQKSATASKSVGDLNKMSILEGDFSKFAYQSNKSISQRVSHT